MSSLNKEIKILYVEDDKDVREGYVRTLNRITNSLYIANDGKEGLELYQKYNPEIIISDIKMPNMSGIEMAQKIKEINPNQAIIFTTAHSESRYLLESIDLQIDGYILKPVDKKQLKDKILKIVKILQFEEELKQKDLIVKEVANLQNNLLVLFDNSFKSIFANQEFLEFFEIKNCEEFEQKYKSLCSVFKEKDGCFFSSNRDYHKWIKEFEKFPDDKRVVSIFDKKESMDKMFLLDIKFIKESSHTICTFSEITTIVAKTKEYEMKAFIDELTKIYNRAKFNIRLNEEVALFKRYNKDLSLILFDIDYFKKLNDKYGHQVGDEILIELSKVVSNRLRKTDVFARWGGEEFAILLPYTNLKIALKVANELRKIIENYQFNNSIKIKCSFGVTQIEKFDNEQTFFKRADEALYKAKEGGRNRVEGWINN